MTDQKNCLIGEAYVDYSIPGERWVQKYRRRGVTHRMYAGTRREAIEQAIMELGDAGSSSAVEPKPTGDTE